LDIGDDLQFD
jgi:hypothetical protein